MSWCVLQRDRLSDSTASPLVLGESHRLLMSLEPAPHSVNLVPSCLLTQ